MSKSVEDDAATMRRIRQTEWRRRWVLAALAIVLMCIGVALGLFLGLNKARLSSPQSAWIIGGFLVLAGAITAGTILLLRRLGPDLQALRDPFASGYSERLQRQRRRFFLFLPIILLLDLPSAITATVHIGRGEMQLTDPVSLLPFFLFGLSALLMLGGVGGNAKVRRLMDDELTLTIRRKSLQAGYFATIAAITGQYLLSLVWPGLALVGFPIVLAVAMSIPALYMAWLEWQAERDD